MHFDKDIKIRKACGGMRIYETNIFIQKLVKRFKHQILKLFNDLLISKINKFRRVVVCKLMSVYLKYILYIGYSF